jgi:hypothetical protein
MKADRWEASDVPGMNPETVAALLNERDDCNRLLQAHGHRVTGQPLIDAVRGLLEQWLSEQPLVVPIDD